MYAPTLVKVALIVAVPLINRALPSVRVVPPASVAVNVTGPVGVPMPGDCVATVAVTVTLWPIVEGLGALVRVVVELSWVTVCVRGGVLLPAALPSPL